MYPKTVVFPLIFAGVGLIAGYFLHGFFPSEQPAEEQGVNAETGVKQVRQMNQYTYINPLLECEVSDGSLDARKENFRDDLDARIDELKQEKKLTEVAVYFRDLNNGPAFGIDEMGEFFPASLLKVPVMMAYYHLAEQNPSILEREILFEKPKDFGITPTIKPREELRLGQAYTVDDLIRRMIVYSDNQSLVLLVERLPPVILQDLFAMLGVGSDVLVNPNSKLSVKEYAGFFRILFNSSYLSRESSERALALLASTDYNDGLPAGVPDSVIVAHKFGEAGTGDMERQLHDCGIVYFPGHPYLACVMTRGTDSEQLKETIVTLSEFIYTKVREQY